MYVFYLLDLIGSSLTTTLEGRFYYHLSFFTHRKAKVYRGATTFEVTQCNTYSQTQGSMLVTPVLL